MPCVSRLIGSDRVSQKEPYQNLDKLLLAEGFNGRIECSLARSEVFNATGVDAKEYERLGLGVWLVSMLSIEKMPSIIIGSPAQIDRAGCSLWFQKSNAISNEIIAAAMDCAFFDCGIAYLCPDNGELIIPDYRGLQARLGLKRTVTLRIPFDEVLSRLAKQENIVTFPGKGPGRIN